MRKLTVGNVMFLNVRKQIVSYIFLECRYLVLVYHSVETFQNVLSQTFCKEHNIKQVTPLVSIKNTKLNLGILNVKSVNKVIYAWFGYMCTTFMYVES